MSLIYHGDRTSREDVASAFGVVLSEDTRILYARYDYECWEGIAWVVFECAGELYEVNASHDSTYDLEGQWDEEWTSLEAIRQRPGREDFLLSPSPICRLTPPVVEAGECLPTPRICTGGGVYLPTFLVWPQPVAVRNNTVVGACSWFTGVRYTTTLCAPGSQDGPHAAW